MRKDFFANSDGDEIFFFSIELDSDMEPLDSRMIDKNYALSNNPTILNITELNYFPAKMSVWNGLSFTPPTGEEHRPACSSPCENGCETIAFLVDNVYYGGVGLCVGVSNNDLRIAALSSDPEITFKIVEA